MFFKSFGCVSTRQAAARLRTAAPISTAPCRISFSIGCGNGDAAPFATATGRTRSTADPLVARPPTPAPQQTR